MVRIRVDPQQLADAIADRAPNWREWADLKPLFLDLQTHKCGFCQDEIGGRLDPRTDGRDLYTQDVEHYRPKRAVTVWTPPEAWPEVPDLHHGPVAGYPWLALEPGNYLAACKTCNSARKKNFFPIRQPLADYAHEPSVSDLGQEQPFVIFPFGDSEATEPEELITFLGADPIPHPDLALGSSDYWRAKVTIEVLGLDRVDLRTSRLESMVEVASYWCLMRLATATWRPIVEAYAQPGRRFSSRVL